jgi:hypothetical protein
VTLVDGPDGTDRVAPTELLLTWTADMTDTYRVALSTPVAFSGAVVWHSVDVQRVSLDDPAMLAPATAPWGHRSAPSDAGPTPVTVDNGVVYSGASSARLAADTSVAMVQELTSFALEDGFYAVGVIANERGTTGCVPAVFEGNSRFFRQARRPAIDAKMHRGGNVPGSWQHLSTVARRWTPPGGQEGTYNATNDLVAFGCSGSGVHTDVVLDDAYVVALEQATIELGPADFDDSLSGARLLVDGADVATQTLTDSPAAGGLLEVRIVPGMTGSALSCDPATLFEVTSGQPDAWFQVSLSPTAVTLTAESADGPITLARGVSGLWGQEQVVRVTWNLTTISLVVEGQSNTSGALDGAFAADFNLIRFGVSADGGGRCPVAVRIPGALEQP